MTPYINRGYGESRLREVSNAIAGKGCDKEAATLNFSDQKNASGQK